MVLVKVDADALNWEALRLAGVRDILSLLREAAYIRQETEEGNALSLLSETCGEICEVLEKFAQSEPREREGAAV